MLRWIEHGRRYVLWLAANSGRRGMDLELDGDLEAAERYYSAAYKLMTDRQDRLVQWYKKLQ